MFVETLKNLSVAEAIDLLSEHYNEITLLKQEQPNPPQNEEFHHLDMAYNSEMNLKEAHHNEINLLKEAHYNEINVLKEDRRNELKVSSDSYNALEWEYTRMRYLAAIAGCRTILDSLALQVHLKHAAIEGPNSCQGFEPNAPTLETIHHIQYCNMISPEFKACVVKLMKSRLRLKSDDAVTLCKKLGDYVKWVDLDCARDTKSDTIFVPCAYGPGLRHLIIAAVVATRRSFEVVNEDFKVLTEQFEPGLTDILDPLTTKKLK